MKQKQRIYISGKGFVNLLTDSLKNINYNDIGKSLLDSGIQASKTALKSGLETGSKLAGQRITEKLIDKILPKKESDENIKKLQSLQDMVKQDIENYSKKQNGGKVKRKPKYL